MRLAQELLYWLELGPMKKYVAIARKLGLTNIIYADKQDVVKEVLEMTNGRGADLVVEASGSAKAVNSSVGMVRRLD